MEKCCICLEEKNIIYKCDVCKDGLICGNCIGDLDPTGSIFGDEEYVKKSIKCPCCRALNWKYHFSQIVITILGDDLFHNPDDVILPAIKIFYKNADIKSYNDCEECGEEYSTWWESDYCEECRN